MGPIGMPELIVIFMALIFLALPVGLVIVLVWYLSTRSKRSQRDQALQPPKSAEDRLSELEGLRSQHLISEAEYEEKRRQILSSI